MAPHKHFRASDQSTMVVDGNGSRHDSEEPRHDEPVVPTSVGRYLLLEQVGKGGMGTVHSAFDPELGRTVAIKLMYASRSQERLRREAQAIAQVSHANVISVHDVGNFENGQQRGVFMVMELVEGLELGSWLAAQKRTWSEVIDVFIQAGRGLQAAHAEGVIHRDFKPSNVIVDARGHAQVLDFGLARGVTSESDEAGDEAGDIDDDDAVRVRSAGDNTATKSDDDSPADSRAAASLSASARSKLLTAPLTRHGVIMGTPRYMSPEQHVTSVVDAHSDQYSFCLALYGALYDKQPFIRYEQNLDLLAVAKLEGIDDWDGADVPDHIEAALRRGLAATPEDRWPDMATLVDALAKDPSARRRRWLIGGGAVLALALVVGAGVGWDARVVARCEDQRAWMAEAWGANDRGTIDAAFALADRPYARSAFEHASAALDTYAEQLGQARAQLCLTEHNASLEPSVIAARGRCLDERHDQLRVVVERLSSADATVVEHAADVLSALPDVAPCTHLTAYAGTDSDPAARQAIERDLFAAKLTAAEGREQAALEMYDDVLARARTLDDPHTLTLVLTRGGELYGSARRLEQSEALAGEAVLLAEQYGEHDLAIDALSALAKTLEDLRGRWDDAQRTLDLARAKYAREPGGSAGEWQFHYIQASIHMQHGRVDEAVAQMRIAADGARSEGSGMELAKVLQALSRMEIRADEIGQAEAHARESIQIRTRLYGLDHPNLMYPYRALAGIADARGDHGEAIKHLDLVIALGERHHGADAPGLVEPHSEKASALRRLGRYEEALAELDESLRLRRVNDASGSEILRIQSQVSLRLNRPQAALELADQALAEHRKELGADEQVPWLRSRFVMHHGEALFALGRLDAAVIDFERAAELRAAEKSDELLIRIWADAGHCRLAQGNVAAARELFERAHQHREAGHETDGRVDGMLDFGLARVAEDPRVGREWANKAIVAYESHGGDDDLANEVRAWMQLL